jgi:N-acetylglucosamine repressor
VNTLKKGSFQGMKSLNKSIVLNKIRNNGPISRAQIAKETSLTPPTVSSIVKELIDSKLVTESQQGVSNGGRKPTMLIINGDGFYVIGIDVGPKTLRIVLTNLNGKVLDQHAIDLPSTSTNETLLNLMVSQIQRMMDANEDKPGQIIGIGVGMHGVVDVAKGVSLFAPNLQLRDIPIKETLESHFQVMIKVENDARAMALGEAWFGSGNGTQNVVTVNVGRGIGAGIVLEGKLFHGDTFLAGEIGHMAIDLSGKKCICGSYGCLQTVAAGPAIGEAAQKELSMGKSSVLRDWIDGDLEKINGEMVYKGAVEGDSVCVSILENTGIYLGIGFTNLIHLLNPSKIIIGGGVSNAGNYILNSIRETIHQRGLTQKAKTTEVTVSKLGQQATAIGAVALILVDLFHQEEN